MRDGRILSNHDDVPPRLVEAVRAELELMESIGPRRFGRRGRLREGLTTDERLRQAPPGGLGPAARARRGEFVAIMVSGMPVGRVVVLPGGPPFSRIVRLLGPTIALVATSVLIVGTTLIALVIFGPARRRLKDVQGATERLGGGDLDARAPEHGGDEVAALARSFNQMAGELAHRTRALESADAARRQLLADVSHELMTPLTAMRGYLETLSMSEIQVDAPTRERYLQIVSEETHRLERIVGDLLDLARLEGGGTTIRHEPVRIAPLFDRVAARHERETQQRDITLETRVNPGADEVMGDPDRLEQALQNLAANALRHTPNGGRITLTSTAAGPGATDPVRLSVHDSGPGIPENHLPLIFERFYKADASRKAAGGSGLGLSIVKTIIERHGGTITARNDHGAVFEIVLPRAASSRRDSVSAQGD
jgi:two-component system sensor histidine kinase BaeS